ncbi:hypothetical protein Salat_0196000 [Sesamum alatum]|uniref:Zinc knuckle CX2CX4HX4C domain-containing protein n=1 Tax=Sesamum alatum TaxID=300844 RepID=A0AAE1YXK8_9LAMI|nr:hypothetical protein Salat_0196000 [Sesamum alatum]
MAEFIGNQLGQFRELDLEAGRHSWGSARRIQVGLDIQKPLRRVLKLRTLLGAESLISFTYERLPNFCYWCKQLGYITKFCECKLEPRFNEKQDPLSFSPWLRATTLAGLRS